MLNHLRRQPSRSSAAALVALLALCSCCVHRVDPRPNTEVRRTEGQALLVVNTGATRLEMLDPGPASASIRLVLAPGEQTRLDFVLSEQTNRGPAGEIEILPVRKGTSSLLGWSGPDLVLRLRFDGEPAEEVRVGVGRCLFDRTMAGHEHELRLASPPLPGIPVLRLCE